MPPTARAAVLTEPGKDLVFQDYPLTGAPPGGAVVRVSCCTICRSDLHTWRGRRPGPTPAILGHEIVGTIAELGDGLTHDAAGACLAKGDRVTWTLHSCCKACVYCCDLRIPMKCENLRKYGHEACDKPPHLQGGFAEYCELDAGTSVFKLPEGLSDLVAAPANCATATVMAAWEAADARPRESILILGAGALSCYAAALAAHEGCQRVIATDVNAARLEFIRGFGATDCINASRCSDREIVVKARGFTDGLGVDCVLEMAGTPSVVPIGLASLRKGGVFVEVGCSFPDAVVSLDMSQVLWNLLTIHGVHNYDARHLGLAVRFLEETADVFPFESIVGQRFRLDEVNHALRAAESGDAVRVAVINQE